MKSDRPAFLSQLYRCSHCQSERVMFVADGAYWSCPCGKKYTTLSAGIPIFACAPDNASEYSMADTIEFNDNALEWVFQTFGVSERDFRSELVSKLQLDTGGKVLVTGVGSGNDLPFLAELVGKEGLIVAQDFSKQMIQAAHERSKSLYSLGEYQIEFSLSDALCLPFFDQTFDAAYHLGGINEFASIRQGIAEMHRVVKEGGKVVICDEGIAPWLCGTALGKALICNNPLYARKPPVEEIPETARDVQLSWVLKNVFYVIDYRVSHQALEIDLDIPHKGRRGGTIRTRYFGQLEGVDPTLKNQVFARAEALGKSRVEFLEEVLHAALEKPTTSESSS